MARAALPREPLSRTGLARAPITGPDGAVPLPAGRRMGIGRARLRLLALALGAAIGMTAAGLWVVHGQSGQMAGERVRGIESPAPLAGARAGDLGRRVAAAQADVTAIWRHDFRWRLGRAYLPPEVIAFSRARPSPCAGVRAMPGPFYCPLDRTLSVDLAFLDRLEAQLRGEGKRAVALMVARLGAEHVQAELAILGDLDRRRPGLDRAGRRALDEAAVLQADCLAGVWARRAEARIGAIEPGAWGRVVAAARSVAPEAAASARLDGGSIGTRDAAFASGYEDGEIRACLRDGLAGVLG